MRSYRISAREREDGSFYMTSPDLPGLHLVCPRGEDPATVIGPVLHEFLPVFYSAQARNQTPIISRVERPNEYALVASLV
jgi:hypothetical protein